MYVTFAGRVDAALFEVLCFHSVKGFLRRSGFWVNQGKTVVD